MEAKMIDWINDERRARVDKLAPSERFVDVRLLPGEASAILRALGGTVRSDATNGDIAGAIAAAGNRLVLQQRGKAK
jgi:hypothetical protein